MSQKISHRFVASLDEVPAASWDALTQRREPFLHHAFLSALEHSRSVGTVESGWVPEHLLIEEGSTLVAAMPLYRKFDSYGEFIFDWAWAQASLNAGIAYYPKLVAAIPYTPATGTRLLLHPEAERKTIVSQMALALVSRCKTEQLSGVHVLFCREDEAKALFAHGFHQRLSYQFHWQRAPHWHCFDDYLASLRHAQRKQIRKERARASSHGLVLSMRPIHELSERELAHLYGFYRHTVWEKGAIAYLTPQMFALLHKRNACGAWVAMAHRNDTPIAAALFFRGENALYGRYWGASESLDALHFELCYYLPIELCIRERIDLFEAGAQGEHKLKRGLLPNRCFSAHHIVHPGLMTAVRRAVDVEREHVTQSIAALNAHSPYRQTENDSPAEEMPSATERA